MARCFLFLVNYARVKPEIALKALPQILNVGYSIHCRNYELSDNRTSKMTIP
jgi:hypothetical protein